MTTRTGACLDTRAPGERVGRMLGQDALEADGGLDPGTGRPADGRG